MTKLKLLTLKALLTVGAGLALVGCQTVAEGLLPKTVPQALPKPNIGEIPQAIDPFIPIPPEQFDLTKPWENSTTDEMGREAKLRVSQRGGPRESGNPEDPCKYEALLTVDDVLTLPEAKHFREQSTGTCDDTSRFLEVAQKAIEQFRNNMTKPQNWERLIDKLLEQLRIDLNIT